MLTKSSSSPTVLAIKINTRVRSATSNLEVGLLRPEKSRQTCEIVSGSFGGLESSERLVVGELGRFVGEGFRVGEDLSELDSL